MCMEYGRYAHLTRGLAVSSLSTSYVRYLRGHAPPGIIHSVAGRDGGGMSSLLCTYRMRKQGIVSPTSQGAVSPNVVPNDTFRPAVTARPAPLPEHTMNKKNRRVAEKL